MIALALALALTTAPATADTQRLAWQDRQAVVTRTETGFLLDTAAGTRHIARHTIGSDTASVAFDAWFALALDELAADSVAAIRDAAFDHGAAMPCACFETGERWHYVWTRDASYAIDLGLWRLDPARARASLRFKLSPRRDGGGAPGALEVMQDTGSGGSWPVSSDRVVWFLAARHLLADPTFAATTWNALTSTLATDRANIYDARFGLYRGETSFLDWREQSYPAWMAQDVVPIAGAFALSTNVLHLEALRLAARLAAQRGDRRATGYAAQAAALRDAIRTRFLRPGEPLPMSWIGADGQPVASHDLLGIALAIESGVLQGEAARAALANYPAWPAGSPVIWPERSDQPIYHNRAIWPFVSAHALRAAHRLKAPTPIAFQLHSLLRGALLAGSNMENFELESQRVHVEGGAFSGPVVNSPRQLWSVAGALDAVIEGVFGLEADGRLAPQLPASLLPELFGTRHEITLTLPGERITLRRPAVTGKGNLLVAERIETHGTTRTVVLKAITAPDLALRLDAPLYAPVAPAAPTVTRKDSQWRVTADARGTLYENGRPLSIFDGQRDIPMRAALQCFSLTTTGANGLESLPGAPRCVGPFVEIGGAWPRAWTAPASGTYQVSLRYVNDHGPINTGITAAVKRLAIACASAPVQTATMVLPHSVGEADSTSARFAAQAGARCTFTLDDGFNMSHLAHNAHYTGGSGGAMPLNAADIGALRVVPVEDAP